MGKLPHLELQYFACLDWSPNSSRNTPGVSPSLCSHLIPMVAWTVKEKLVLPIDLFFIIQTFIFLLNRPIEGQYGQHLSETEELFQSNKILSYGS